ncbi:unnamed protein product, partial [Prorocentrum cordatum]
AEEEEAEEEEKNVIEFSLSAVGRRLPLDTQGRQQCPEGPAMSETGCFAARGSDSAAPSNGRTKIANCSPCMSREQWLESEVSRLRNELRQKEKDAAEKSQRAAAAAAASADSGGSEALDAKQVNFVVDGSPGDPTPSSKANVEDYREDISAVMREESAGVKETAKVGNKVRKTPSERFMNMSSYFMRDGILDRSSLANSVLGFQKPMAVAMYAVAFAGIVFVLISQAKHLGADDGHGAATTTTCGATEVDDHAGDAHRRLYGAQGRRLGGDAPDLIIYIAFVLTASGLIALILNAVGLPLILGYILGGVLVGPEVLEIVPRDGQTNMEQAASLGLIFLLFMIGLELDVKETAIRQVVLCTGFFQYPVCFGIMWGICAGFGNELWGGTADYPLAAMYCGMVCGISSTMIVVKALSEKFETDTQSGRLTIGILIFQDIWAIVVLAVQPKLDSPEIVPILITFAKMAILLAISLTYAKFVMPAVLFYASKSVELMLVLSLAWCFFIGCIAIQPYMGLSFELASLIAGVALATFPYSAEFNGKIKFIRDFFITLFFAQLGMQIPVPAILPIMTAVLMVRLGAEAIWHLLDFENHGGRCAACVSGHAEPVADQRVRARDLQPGEKILPHPERDPDNHHLDVRAARHPGHLHYRKQCQDLQVPGAAVPEVGRQGCADG